MPFKDLRHPPIQLGILQQCLERAGITAQCHALELAFMEHLHAKTSDDPLTIWHYQRIATQDFPVQPGEWMLRVRPAAEPSSAEQEYNAYANSHGPSDEVIGTTQRK